MGPPVIAERANEARLRAHIEALEGRRHPETTPDALAAAEDYVADQLAALDLPVNRPAFEFDGRTYHNVVATLAGSDPALPRVLVGAHFDSARETPGADDNASGVAALLEVARLLAGHDAHARTIEFAGFNLEEPQGGLTWRVGSRAFARQARAAGARYLGALVLEMVGYTDPRPRSQTVPWLLFWKRVPRRGTFLAATGDGQSAALLRRFAREARDAVPALPIVTFRTPLRGWVVPHTRLSDNASFWDEGYPALMVTDTAFLRNPHYHQGTDRRETLDFTFMARVATAVTHVARRLANDAGIR